MVLGRLLFPPSRNSSWIEADHSGQFRGRYGTPLDLVIEVLFRAVEQVSEVFHADGHGFKQTGTVKLRPSVRNAYGMDRFSCSRAWSSLKRLDSFG